MKLGFLEDDLQAESRGCLLGTTSIMFLESLNLSTFLDFQLRLSWIREKETMFFVVEKKMSVMEVMCPQHTTYSKSDESGREQPSKSQRRRWSG